ncbi:hypothetical protein GGS23DRAFT_103769 [Durotheca rogersii]|uniref:uncharacterized protein n=1 Tax=Durotheca rogersii TaxID=419775 RepID=UPI00221F0285|nr:uncharacterized protein GGS23DRAFT_103769 [Durotheca rogersii]KAI5862078.1 hypothetical protein GGS23DRAFT_103769 [Durotheca rogersii]
MVVLRWALGAVVAASAVSASTDELQFFSRLLKRQDPGTPAYNCHDNCGQAIIQARNSADVCNDNIFLTNYGNCLQCSGPDNVNIWRFYGTSLSRAAEPCGLSTEPLAGVQPDVGPAIPAGSNAGSTSSTAEPSSSSTAPPASEPETSSTNGPTEEPTSEPTSGPTSSSGNGGETSGPQPTASSSGGADQTSATSGPSETNGGGSPTATVTDATSSGGSVPTFASSGTASTTAGGQNGTSPSPTSTGPPIVTGGANAAYGSAVGFYGALALGALFAVAH